MHEIGIFFQGARQELHGRFQFVGIAPIVIHGSVNGELGPIEPILDVAVPEDASAERTDASSKGRRIGPVLNTASGEGICMSLEEFDPIAEGIGGKRSLESFDGPGIVIHFEAGMG
jgi:hypothetical protein